MPVPPISQLPVAPQVTDTPAVFSDRANTFVAALSTLVTETNASIDEINDAVAGNLVQFDGFKGTWEAGTFDQGDVVFYAPDGRFYIALEDAETAEPPAGSWVEIGESDAASISYDNTTSGLTATDVQAAIDEVAGLSPSGYFAKSDRDSVAWEKTGNDTAKVGQTIFVEVGGEVLTIAADTTISMPSLTAGTDYAIWVAPDGTVEADDSFSVAPTAGGRRVGGFHYAPGGRATGTSGGSETTQIMETSFYDLKWRPSVLDPRGLVLVGDGAFWAGMYLMSANHLTGPVHKYNVDPCRDGNAPQNITAAGNYPNASPANIIEALQYHGFRAPDFWEFQLLAYGTTEATSLGGTGPGLTGVLSSGEGTKERFTSQWGVFDATGVLGHWGNDTILTTSDQTLPNPARGGRFRYSHFPYFGGTWADGARSGSRLVDESTATISSASVGSRGVCDHLILD